jgi:hypothetical protein
MKVNKVKLAYDIGYRVVNGEVYSKRGQKVKGRDRNGYLSFSLRLPVRITGGTRKKIEIPVHHLVAYQKFGDAMFEPAILVRHKDDNPSNNLEDNILIGTPSQNMMDKPPELRKKIGIEVGLKIRIWTDELIQQVKMARIKEGLSYRQLSERYNLGGKDRARHIVKYNCVTFGMNSSMLS